MTRPNRMDAPTVDAWLARHSGWARTEDGSLAKPFSFPDFASALAFTVRVGCWAEKHDHHPVVALTWGSAKVAWSTHDAGGITELDLNAAEATDKMAG